MWRRGGAPRWGAGGCAGRGGAEAVETVLRHVPVLKVLTRETTSHLSSLHSIRNRVAPQVHTPSHACSCTAEAAPALHRLEVRSAPRPACRPAVSAPPCAGRGAALALTEAKGRPAARLLCAPPTHTEPPARCSADRQRACTHRPARPRRPLPGSHAARLRPRRPRPTAHAPRLRRLPPARVPPARLHTAARSCTQRADEAPAVAADRSLSGLSRLRCSRPAEPGLFRAKRARGAAGPHAAALIRPLQPGGQRSHGTTEDRGSRQSASMSARPARPYRRRRAHAAAQRRSGLKRRSLTAALAKRRAACRVNCVTVRVK